MGWKSKSSAKNSKSKTPNVNESAVKKSTKKSSIWSSQESTKSGGITSISELIKPEKSRPPKWIDPLIIILSIIGLLSIGSLILFCFFGPSSSVKSNDRNANSSSNPFVCITPECVHTAANLLSSMNPEIDPCQDFYLSACGRFNESHIDMGTDIQGTLQTGVKLKDLEILNMLTNSNTKSEAEKKAKEIFLGCFVDEIDTKTLYGEIQKLGGCSALDENWNSDGYDMTKTIIAMAKVMPEDLGFFRLSADERSGKIYFEMRYSPKPSIQFEDWSKYLTEILARIASSNSLPSVDAKRLNSILAQVYNLEITLMEIKPPDDPAEMSTTPNIAHFDQDRFVSEISKTTQKKFKYVALSSDYFEKLFKIMSETNFEVIQNFLVFRFIAQMTYMAERNQNTESGYLDKSMFCTKVLQKLVPGTLGLAYVTRFVDTKNVEPIEKMAEDIKLEYEIEFKKNKWMDEITKKNALKKLEEMRYFIGFPKHYLDSSNDYLKRLFEKFDIKPLTETFLKTTLKILSSYSKDFFASYSTNENMNFSIQIGEFSAIYFTFMNSLQLSSPFLRSPIFDVSLPDYYKFGSVGMMLAHEIGHGFDTGRYKKIWTGTSKEKFLKKADCLIDQYGKLELGGHKLDGAKLLNENIADTLGIPMAFNAMKKKLAEKKKDEIFKIPGLQQFTPEQISFYGFANILCSTIKPSAIKPLLELDVHTPNHLRINTAFANFEEFARAFKCKPNSPMNPTKRCKLL